ncbi:hypothetical protein D554_3296 [Bordetella holmesii 30539]|uniref:N-acetyltransferase YedL n=1 Tax=Bordetella holmesii 1058 TaxID=1247648 RepID=A0ABN0RXQ9_9BORD|nr:hypothetical protein D560_3400 [Bordetella holmesii ATCC 51541]EWM40787.1 hypothetical protein D555_3432 [Bordetella holmesii 35009]EWM42784.1 hypothetical protein D556_3366 [Bordetella holmesii 41130]EWM44683.1 hypothetical protein D557_2672 [Bordetella holmesii 70147]EXF88019.1 hypothetical protein D554_3296 [Bordetella holmesii 30539]EXX94021.1 hypothetical protein D559_1430 [Bordetella holmesii 1058]
MVAAFIENIDQGPGTLNIFGVFHTYSVIADTTVRLQKR